MSILLTGASGFLGWHIRCRAASEGISVVVAPRGWVADPALLHGPLAAADGVIHAAGVNRGSDEEVTAGNEAAADALARALKRTDGGRTVVYANSTHAEGRTAYGRAKAVAAKLLAAGTTSSSFYDVRLANLFGEHGRPDYNSFVATFCHRVAAGQPLEVVEREVSLLHVQDAAGYLLHLATEGAPSEPAPQAELTTVATVATKLSAWASTYRTGEIPSIVGKLDRRLFSTFRSFCFPTWYPLAATPRSDMRGRLIECVRARSDESQVFISTTVPSATRGEHYHLRKMERFVVIDGHATIALRRLFSRGIVTFRVSGNKPVMVDMPCMWTHNITNTGPGSLTTLFWTDELFNPESRDTYPCVVESAELSP